MTRIACGYQALAALFADGPTRIDNVYNWRVKETERMVAIVAECRKLGAEVRGFEEVLRMLGCSSLEPTRRLEAVQ